MSGLPQYSQGDHTVEDVDDSKARPPGYLEAAETRQAHIGEIYAEKFVAKASEGVETWPSKFTVHVTETDNFVLLTEDAQPIYYIDNTSSLSKTIVRRGDSTRGMIISTSKSAGPFVKEIQTNYENRVRSGTSSTKIQANGRFSIAWSFEYKHDLYEWKHHKGVWMLTQGKRSIAKYDVGQSLDVEVDCTKLADVIVSTVSAIDLYDRLTSERRHRALQSVTGKSAASGLLL